MVDDVLADDTSIPAEVDQFIASDDITLTTGKRNEHFQALWLQPLLTVRILSLTRNRIDRRAADAEHLFSRKLNAGARTVHWPPGPEIIRFQELISFSTSLRTASLDIRKWPAPPMSLSR